MSQQRCARKGRSICQRIFLMFSLRCFRVLGLLSELQMLAIAAQYPIFPWLCKGALRPDRFEARLDIFQYHMLRGL